MKICIPWSYFVVCDEIELVIAAKLPMHRKQSNGMQESCNLHLREVFEDLKHVFASATFFIVMRSVTSHAIFYHRCQTII